MKTVLVIGATGMIGRIVSSQLLEDGYGVVAMVRDPSKAGNELKKGIELIRGDVTSYNDVLQACRNADFIHISTSGGNNQENIMAVEYEGTLNVLQAAIEMRIKHITMISGMHVNKDSLDHPAEKAKYLAENAIKSSSTPYTIFKPTFFMETLERHIQGNKAVIIGKQPKALNMIAAKDLAKNISKTYQMNEAINQVFYPKGKEAIKLKNALEQYVSKKYPGMKVQVVPIWLMQIADKLFMNGKLSRVIGIMKLLQKEGEAGSSDHYFNVYGDRTTPFDQWLKLNT